MTKKVLTLCLIVKDDRVLLGMKKRGFGMGKWNGFGGKLHDGESIEDATRRETLEECGVIINTMEKAGMNTFTFEGDPTPLEVH
jgi:8-oxo-dGTP diphosphatase/2-hydroxy-dATP diphosphatase